LMNTQSLFLASAWRGTGPEFNKAVEGCSASIRKVVDEFAHNIHGAAAIVSIPHRLAMGGLAERRVREAIRKELSSVTIGSLAQTEAQRKEAVENAALAALENVQPDGLAELGEALKWTGLGEDDLQELLGQGTVLSWSSVEVFCREFLRVALNTLPTLRVRFAQSKKLRKDCGIEAFGWSELIDANFDLRNCLGDILTRRFDIKDIGTARRVFDILFAGIEPVHVALADPQLTLLAARRHLIVHRRRVIDRKYLDATGEKASAGTKLRIEASELSGQMRACCDLVQTLARATVTGD